MLKQIWISFFNILFLIQRGKRVKCVIKKLEKPQETFKNSLYTCFKCERNNVFSAEKQLRSANGGTSVFREYRDCHNKWRNGWQR